MTGKSIAAYDVSQRVKTYDADMDLMHPSRSKMVQVALEVLPFPKTATLRAIDLGIGSGYFMQRFLDEFANSSVIGSDGAQAMIQLAKARLQSLASRPRAKELKRFCNWTDGRPKTELNSNSIATQQTRSLVSRIKQRHSSRGFFNRALGRNSQSASAGA